MTLGRLCKPRLFKSLKDQLKLPPFGRASGDSLGENDVVSRNLSTAKGGSNTTCLVSAYEEARRLCYCKLLLSFCDVLLCHFDIDIGTEAGVSMDFFQPLACSYFKNGLFL